MEINYNHKIPGVVTDDIILRGTYGNLEVTGVLNGSVVVKAPAHFVIHGVMNGNLQIEEGASVELRGILNAESIQNNGSFDVFGIISCKNIVLANATLHAGCIVNGIQH